MKNFEYLLIVGLLRPVQETSVLTLSVLAHIWSLPALFARMLIMSDCVFKRSMTVRSFESGGKRM